MSKLIAFPWYGGKFSHLNWLLPIIDECDHYTYVEPYGGAASVILNKKQSPVEVYNDIFSDVVNFFKALRDNKDQLIEKIELTPYSREEFENAILNPSNDSVERARQFFVKARQCFSGLATRATVGLWSTCKKDSRRGMALNVSKWLSSTDKLTEISERLKFVQIENLPAIEIIKKYDTEKTLFYLDPPYIMQSRSGGKAYKYEMTDKNHLELMDTLKSAKGKSILSGYDNDLYDKELFNWNKEKSQSKISHASKCTSGSGKERQEVIWKNF